MSVREYILKSFDKEYEQRSLMELRKAPVSAISGISETDAASLKDALAISTVEDLATNKYVLLAQAISAFSRFSGKILDKEFSSTEFEELRKKPVWAISGVSEADATLLKNAFGTITLQDLAENKYVRIAQLVTLNAQLFETAGTVQAPQQASQQKTQPTKTQQASSQSC